VVAVSFARYSKIAPALKAAEDAVAAAAALSGVEPDVYGGRGPLVVLIEKDDGGYKDQGARQGHSPAGDWAAVRSSSDGVFYSPTLAKGNGAAVTYFHDEEFVRFWAGRGAFEAYAGRITDITRLDPVLLDAFAAYFGSFVGDKYHPVTSSRYLFDRTKQMRPLSKMFEGFKRGVDNDSQLQLRQSGFAVHFLAKKSPEGTQRALQKFLAGNVTHRELVETALGKVDPGALDKEFAEFWAKFQSTFQP